MKKNILISIFSLLAVSAIAQLNNDECSGAVDLGIAPVCQNTVYSNTGGTPSDIGQNNTPECFINTPTSDVWFTFITDSEITDYNITIQGEDNNGNPISGIQAAVYRGFCPDNIFSLNTCAVSEIGASQLTFQVNNLAPNDLYYIRVDQIAGVAGSGDFSICIEKQDTEYTMNDGFSDDCSGILYDSGGPNGDYSAGEDLVFTICPETENRCIEFMLEYYNIEQAAPNGIGDVLTFYNGENTDAPQILKISGADIEGINGNGGVCYSVYASGCLTVRMTTDNDINLDGFKASWRCSGSDCLIPETITIDDEVSERAIQSALSSSLVDIVVLNIDCPNGAWGTFNSGDRADLGLKDGIVLTTGRAALAMGPNDKNGEGFASLTGGDADLDSLSLLLNSDLLSNDACVIEVEATVNTDELNFQYIFGSEEYPEFENSTFNDIFALFIEGAGIEGIPQLNGKQNLAVLPNTSTPIEIRTVNSTNNWEYFRNNEKGFSTEYDGLVVDYLGSQKSLTASARVIPCNTYRLKFAIADRNDFIFDSGVFISELTNGVPEISVASGSGLDYFVEQCSSGEDLLVFRLPTVRDSAVSFDVMISGSAVQGEDFNLDIPATVTFEPNQQIITFPITIIADQIPEGNEEIILTLSNDYGCGVIEVAELAIIIKDDFNILTQNGQDTVYACIGTDFQLFAEGASSYSWTPANLLSNPNIGNPVFVNPQETTTFIVTGTIDPFDSEACTDTDTLVVIPVQPSLSIVTSDDLMLCEGEEINVELINNTGNTGLGWVDPDLGILSPDSNFTIIRPTVSDIEPIAFIASLTVGGCTIYDTLSLQIDPFEFPEWVVGDTSICQNYELQLAAEVSDPFTSYQWTPSDHLSSDSIANPIATITEDISYKLVATSANEICRDSAQFSITVIPNQVEIIPSMDTLLLCLGDSLDLNTVSTSNGQGLFWTSNAPLSDPTAPGVNVKPAESGYTIVTMNFNGCTHTDSVWIQVDSLPDLSYEIIQDKAEYCLGEVITIVSPGYNEDHFPNITFMWDPSAGIVSDLENMNLAIIAEESTTFRRTATNGACSEITEHEITVLDPSIQIMLEDTSILCPFTPVRISIESESELEEIMWDPEEGLSCTDCPNPIASVGSTTTFTVSAEADGCPASASVEVKVADLFLAIGFEDPVVCPDAPVQLTLASSGEVTNINWSPNSVLSCDDCPDPIATSDETVNISVSAEVDGCEVNASGTLVVDESVRNVPLISDPTDTVAVGGEVTITVVPQNSFGPNTSYEWSVNGNTQNEEGSTFQTTQDDTTRTQYTVFIIDEDGCFWQGGVNLIGVFPRFELPNAFTPNGDDTNDVFRLVQTPTSTLDNWEIARFSIYNRWGEEVFRCETKECAVNQGWDGRVNGEFAPAGVYVYAVSVVLDNGDQINFRGDVTLLR